MIVARLDAPAETPPTAASRPMRGFACLECGYPASSAASNAEFCSPGCRKDWNNRRMKRGAELYDFMMVLRFERGRAKALRLWTMMCRLVAIFREEDRTQRSGRRSWSIPEQVMEKKAFLHATVVLRKRAPS